MKKECKNYGNCTCDKMNKKNIAKMIDHTNLHPQATEADIRKLCQEAITYGFRAVCVNLLWVGLCADILKGTDVKVAAVVDFPLGAGGIDSKITQAELAMKLGASEIDTVINISAIKSDSSAGQLFVALHEINAVADVLPTKVIIETGLLTEEEIKNAAQIVAATNAEYIKTSTGFVANTSVEEKAEHIRIIKSAEPDLKIKAAGGIKTLEDIKILQKAGADIFGASAGIKILEELKK